MGKKSRIILEMDDRDIQDARPKKMVKVLVFSLGEETYCVDIRQAKEVLVPPAVTRVPNAPAFVVGIINLRGSIISLLNVKSFFAIDEGERPASARVIVTDVSGEPVGILIDRLVDTINIDEEKIGPPLSTIKGRLLEFTKGNILVNGQIVIMIDLAKVLKCDEIDTLRKGAK